ncbi:MAG TPA: WYL domain-containing protein, partial [Microlunatus sp.]|nr:WYL domain-containing protein [Microlunatus sp.]
RGARIAPEPAEPGRSRVEIDLENPGEARSVVLGLGGAAVVRSPDELKESVRHAAAELLGLHER